jgi:hypothetical protein
MTFLFRNETTLNKIKECKLSLVFKPLNLWMSLKAGEGEEEIENHGRLRVKSFSQETEAKTQRAPRIGVTGQMLKSLKCRMHEKISDSTPQFFSRLAPQELAAHRAGSGLSSRSQVSGW